MTGRDAQARQLLYAQARRDELLAAHNNAQWFLFADDDTFVNADALLAFAARQNASRPVAFGFLFNPGFWNPPRAFSYFSGGAGMLLSREAFARLVRTAPPTAAQGPPDGGGGSDRDRSFACAYRGGPNDVTISGCLWRAGVLLVHHPGFWPVPPDDAWLCAIRGRRSDADAASARARGQAEGTARSADARLGVLSGSASLAAAIAIHGMAAEEQLAMPLFLQKIRGTRRRAGLLLPDDDGGHTAAAGGAAGGASDSAEAEGLSVMEEVDVGDLLVGASRADGDRRRKFHIPIQFRGLTPRAHRLIAAYADGGGPQATLGPRATDDDQREWQMLRDTVAGFCDGTPSLGERCTPGEILYRISREMRARRAREAERARSNSGSTGTEQGQDGEQAPPAREAAHFGDLRW